MLSRLNPSPELHLGRFPTPCEIPSPRRLISRSLRDTFESLCCMLCGSPTVGSSTAQDMNLKSAKNRKRVGFWPTPARPLNASYRARPRTSPPCVPLLATGGRRVAFGEALPWRECCLDAACMLALRGDDLSPQRHQMCVRQSWHVWRNKLFCFGILCGKIRGAP